jgi:hypothetical protein
LTIIQTGLAKVTAAVNQDLPRIVQSVSQLEADRDMLKEEAQIANDRTKP